MTCMNSINARPTRPTIRSRTGLMALTVIAIAQAESNSALAKSISASYEMPMPTGSTQVRVVNQSSPPDVQMYILTTKDADLIGTIKVNQLSILTQGRQDTTTSLYDMETMLANKALPASQAGPTVPVVNTTTAPVQYRFVTENYSSGPGPYGNYSNSGCWNFQYDYDCASSRAAKLTLAPAIDTTQDGLYLGVRSWSGRPDSVLSVTRAKLTFAGTIDNYQITERVLNLGTLGIVNGDMAYNARNYTNSVVFPILGTFTNRQAGVFDDPVGFSVSGNGGKFVNAGAMTHDAEATLIDNRGSFINDTTGYLHSGGWFTTLGASASFANQGTLVINGTGDFQVDQGASFTNLGNLLVDGSAASLYIGSSSAFNSGSASLVIVHGAQFQIARGATFSNSAGLVIDRGGKFLNEGALLNSGALGVVDGTFENRGHLNLVLGSSSAAASSLTVGQTALMQNSAAGVVRIETELASSGSFTNLGTVVVDNGGMFRLAQGSSLTNSGSIQLINGTVSAVASSIQNAGTIALLQGTTFNTSGNFDNGRSGVLTVQQGAQVINLGQLSNAGTVTVDGELIQSGSYRQDSGQTIVNGKVSGNVDLRGGLLGGSGVVRGTVTVQGGTLAPTLTINAASMGSFAARALSNPAMQIATPTSSLTIDGDLTVDGGEIDLTWSGSGFTGLVVTGNLGLRGSSVRVALVGGFVPSAGDALPWLQAPASSNVDWASVQLSLGVLNADGQWSPQGPAGLALAIGPSGALQITAVPEPSTPILGLLGGCLFGALGWRRRVARRGLARQENDAVSLVRSQQRRVDAVAL
jgi:hypothetical protein